MPKVNWTPILIGVGLAGAAGVILYYSLRKGEKAELTDDAYVDYLNPSTNYNTPQLMVNGVTWEWKQALLKFDIPPIAIKSAILKIYVESINVPGRADLVYYPTLDWSEGSIVYDDLLGTEGIFLSTKDFVASDQGQYVEFDVTSLIQQYAGTSITLSLSSIGYPEETNIVFSSKEGANKPSLEITKY